MSTDEINRAIAEHLGWEFIPCRDDGFGRATGESWRDPDGDIGPFPPDYSTDLNAMREAEKAAFGSSTSWVDFAVNLLTVLQASEMPVADGMTCVLQVTAAQRAEAFLRTIGKWVEPKGDKG